MCGHNIIALFEGGERAMSSLARTPMSTRFHAWLGLSGQRYIVSVFPADHAAADRGLPEFEGCVLIPVVSRGSRRLPLRAFQIERETDRRAALAALREVAIAEWHVHLLAESREDRIAAVADLCARDDDGVVAVPA